MRRRWCARLKIVIFSKSQSSSSGFYQYIYYCMYKLTTITTTATSEATTSATHTALRMLWQVGASIEQLFVVVVVVATVEVVVVAV